MALVGRILAEHGYMKVFLDACAKGGDALQPQSQAMAGLYLGLLKNSVPQVRCLSALQALLEHGLAPAMPLTPSADQWPLHAAARHNCLPVVQVLLVAKADPFARNVRGLTALDVAKNSRSWAAAAAIRRAPFKARGFHVQLVAEALARHIEELHASMVAADVEDVAQALLRHLECQEPTKDSKAADTDIVAGALAQMAAAMPVPKPGATEEEEMSGKSPDSASTDLVANALAQMAFAMPVPKPGATQEEEFCGESPNAVSTDFVASVAARMMMASPLPGSDAFDDVSSGRSDIVHEDVVANILARMVLASPDPKSDTQSDSLRHEEVSSGHSDAANTALAANMLARMVLAASPSPEPIPATQEQEETGSASHVDLVATALAQMVLANGSTAAGTDGVHQVLEDSSDREVATAAARALAGVVVAAHGAADLEEVQEMLSHFTL